MFCNNTKSDINTNVVPLIDGGTDDLDFGPEIEPGTNHNQKNLIIELSKFT